jgi:curved DNA-binding protein CbpA
VPDEVDPYRTLQVDRQASEAAIKTAYRRLARMYHPDVAAGPEAAARMSVINVAWELIGEPAARRRYDRAHGIRISGAADDAPPGGARRAPTPPPEPPRPAPPPPPPAAPPKPMPPPEQVSRDWTSGRSSVGGGYDPTMHAPDGTGAAGPPPGRPSGSILNFGRYAGWSLGEIARKDIEFIEWLDRTPIGRPYHDEIDLLLRKAGRRTSDGDDAEDRRGLFRRR